MKNEQWLNEKLSNFTSFIQSNLKPIEDQSEDTKDNVNYVMSMSLDDWLSFASKHLMKFKNTPQDATTDICEMYGISDASQEVKDKITRYIELFIEVLS